MPRKARIYAPGALHHIIVRGIERRKIFIDDSDRNNFLDRLENVLSDSATGRLGIWELQWWIWLPKLSISQPAVSMSARRGEHIALENGYSLMDD